MRYEQERLLSHQCHQPECLWIPMSSLLWTILDGMQLCILLYLSGIYEPV